MTELYNNLNNKQTNMKSKMDSNNDDILINLTSLENRLKESFNEAKS